MRASDSAAKLAHLAGRNQDVLYAISASPLEPMRAARLGANPCKVRHSGACRRLQLRRVAPIIPVRFGRYDSAQRSRRTHSKSAPRRRAILHGSEFHPRQNWRFATKSASFLRDQLPADIASKIKSGLLDQGARTTRAGRRSSTSAAGARRAGRSSSAVRAGVRCRCTSSTRKRPRRAHPRSIPFGLKMVAPVIMAFGIAGAAEALPAAHHQRRGLVVSGLLRAGRRLRSRVAQDARRAPGRPLHRQRPEDLEHARPVRRLDLLPRAHRSERAEAAAGHLVPADRHEDAGHHRAPDHHDGRRARSERSVARERESAGRESRRRREQGLDLREVPARPRAHEHRRRRRLEARARPSQGHRAHRRSRTAGRCIEDPLFAARIAQVEIDLMALEITNLRALSAEAGKARAGPGGLGAQDQGHGDPAGADAS